MAKTYTTKQGDMWDSIAFAVYGDEYKMTYLMDANPQHIATVVFPAGIILTVSELPAAASKKLPPWKVAT